MIHIIHKVTFNWSCYKDDNTKNNNVKFDEIFDILKHKFRVLSDLYVQSCSLQNTFKFKLYKCVGGNMLPYDVWKEFFSGRSLLNWIVWIIKVWLWNLTKVSLLNGWTHYWLPIDKAVSIYAYVLIWNNWIMQWYDQLNAAITLINITQAS